MKFKQYLTELKKDTLHNYISKATSAVGTDSYRAGVNTGMEIGTGKKNPKLNASNDKSIKHLKGVLRANRKLRYGKYNKE